MEKKRSVRFCIQPQKMSSMLQTDTCNVWELLMQLFFTFGESTNKIFLKIPPPYPLTVFDYKWKIFFFFDVYLRHHYLRKLMLRFFCNFRRPLFSFFYAGIKVFYKVFLILYAEIFILLNKIVCYAFSMLFCPLMDYR